MPAMLRRMSIAGGGGNRLRHQIAAGLRIARVEGEDVPAGLGLDGGEAVAVEIGEDEACPFARQPLGGRPPDPRCRAGDDRHAAHLAFRPFQIFLASLGGAMYRAFDIATTPAQSPAVWTVKPAARQLVRQEARTPVAPLATRSPDRRAMVPPLRHWGWCGLTCAFEDFDVMRLGQQCHRRARWISSARASGGPPDAPYAELGGISRSTVALAAALRPAN